MADGKIEIDTSINTEEAEKGLKNLKKNIEGFSSGNVLKNITKLSGAFSAVTTAVKATTKAIKETSDAYNVQFKAEKQLEVAAKNNPYLNKESVKSLKEYSSYLQSITTHGDEELLPFMAQLASAGRTEAEIQNILKTALDVSATGTMSLDAAVTQLNATYSGNIGMLGRQISELKGLTKEELESGKAVQVISDKYKGMAEEVAKATGYFQQMKNAQGDFNEAVGKLTKPTSDLWNNFWKNWYTKGIESINKLEAGLNAQVIGKKMAEQFSTELSKVSDLGGKIDYTKNALSVITDSELESLQAYLNLQKKRSADEEIVLKRIQAEKDARYQNALNAQAEAEALEKSRQEKEAAAATDDNAIKIINSNQAALDKQIEQIKLNAKLKGEEVDQQEILNAYIQSYIDLVTTDTNLVTENNSAAKTRLELIKKQAAAVADLNEESSYTENFEELQKKLKDLIKTEVEAKQAEIDLLDSQFDQLSAQDKLRVWDDYTKARKQLIKELEDAEKQTTESLTAEKVLETLTDYVSKYEQVMSNLSDFSQKNAENEANTKLAALNKQFSEGIVSEQEYYEKKKEIEREQAQQTYKAQMWTWTAQVAQISANIAQSISKALADGGAAGIALALTMSALGATQLATAIASKPVPPAFANGGIVGATMGPDNTIATVRNGEMVLNAIQQRQLWKVANGQTASSGSNITIKNYRGADTTVTPQIDANGITLLVEKTVQDKLANGKFNRSLQAAQNSLAGISYTS